MAHTLTRNPISQFPTVVETLGLSETVTLVLTCPPYLIAGAATILLSWSSGKWNERTWHITISKAVATIGFAAAAAVTNVPGRYVCMVIFTVGTYGVNSLILGWCGSVCGQTKEKKASAIAIVTTIMNISFVCKLWRFRRRTLTRSGWSLELVMLTKWCRDSISVA